PARARRSDPRRHRGPHGGATGPGRGPGPFRLRHRERWNARATARARDGPLQGPGSPRGFLAKLGRPAEVGASTMDPTAFATAYSLSTSIGLRPFLTLAIASLAMHFGYLHPSHGFAFMDTNSAQTML